MADSREILKKIVDLIDTQTTTFDESIQPIQKDIADELAILVKDLEIRNGKVLLSIKNLKTIGAIKKKLEKIIINPTYKGSVDNLVSSFTEISKLHIDYFNAQQSEVGNIKLLEEIQNQSIEATKNSLLGAGINANLIEPIQDILRQNITTGGKYTDLVTQLSNYISNNDAGLGALQRYTQQITTDSLNQFSRQYHDTISNDLGYDWYMYTGSNKVTTRQWCKLMTAKKWVHKSELPTLVSGEVDGVQCKLNPKTDLPLGMVDNTNEDNVITYCGGYNCGHGFYSVKKNFVPQNIRAKFEQ